LCGLFSPVQKRTPVFGHGVSDVWDQYKQGLLERQEAQQRILRNPDGSLPGASLGVNK
jgi:hypothetical protein